MHLAVADDVQHGGPARSPAADLVGQLVRARCTSSSRSRAGPPTATGDAVDGGLDAPAGQRPEVARPGAGRRRSLARAAATIARASGCSLSASTAAGAAAAARRRSAVDRGDAGDDVLALGQGAGLVEQHGVDGAHPLEGQAVLDQDAGCGPRSPVDRAMTSGMASPRAWGQAITSTVTVRSIAWSGSPRSVHTDEGDQRRRRRRRRTAARRTGRPAPGPASGTLWASSTSRWIPARAVSSPTASTRTRMRRVGRHRAGHHPVADAAWAPGGTRR